MMIPKRHRLSPDQRLLVESNVNHFKIMGPGTVWIYPWQEVKSEFSVGPKSHSFQIDQLRTFDNIPVKITGRILYRVDTNFLTSEQLPQIPGLNKVGWEDTIRWRTEWVLEGLLADFKAENLNQSLTKRRLERRLTNTLGSYMSSLGIRVMGASLIRTELPFGLQKTIEKAKRDAIETDAQIDTLKKYSEMLDQESNQTVQQILQLEMIKLLRKNDNTQVIIGNINSLPDVPAIETGQSRSRTQQLRLVPKGGENPAA